MSRFDVLTAVNTDVLEEVAQGLAAVRDRGGRLFILGVGGSAGHASHAVNDFRKLCDFEAYTPTDNVSELTARVNDEGWDTTFVEWLRGVAAQQPRRASRLLRWRRKRGEARLGQPGAGPRARRASAAPRSSASWAATAASPPSVADCLRGHPAAVPRPRHAAHRGAVRRAVAPAGHPTRRWPGRRRSGSRCDDRGQPRRPRVCVVGGAGFIGSHFVDRAARRATQSQRVTVYDNFSSGR